MEEALQQRTYQDALAGKRMAMREVVKWIMKREAWFAKHAPPLRQRSRYKSSPDPDNADAALVLLGIAASNPDAGGSQSRAGAAPSRALGGSIGASPQGRIA